MRRGFSIQRFLLARDSSVESIFPLSLYAGKPPIRGELLRRRAIEYNAACAVDMDFVIVTRPRRHERCRDLEEESSALSVGAILPPARKVLGARIRYQSSDASSAGHGCCGPVRDKWLGCHCQLFAERGFSTLCLTLGSIGCFGTDGTSDGVYEEVWDEGLCHPRDIRGTARG